MNIRLLYCTVFAAFSFHSFAAAAADSPAAQLTGQSSTPVVSQNVGVFGDSLADGAWSGMYNLNKKHPEVKLFRHAKVGSGITRGDFASWMTDFTAELDADHTTSAVVIVGVNDQQSIRDENHKGYVFKSDGWKRVYLSRIDAITSEFEKRKINVVWFGLPILRDADLNTGAIYLSDLIGTEVKGHNVTFVPLIDAFKDDKGGFASHLPDSAGKIHPVRADDGVHFTPYGYELIGEKAYTAIATSAHSSDALVPAVETLMAPSAGTPTGPTTVMPPADAPLSPTPPAATPPTSPN